MKDWLSRTSEVFAPKRSKNEPEACVISVSTVDADIENAKLQITHTRSSVCRSAIRFCEASDVLIICLRGVSPCPGGNILAISAEAGLCSSNCEFSYIAV